jgi:hypothetical protein
MASECRPDRGGLSPIKDRLSLIRYTRVVALSAASSCRAFAIVHPDPRQSSATQPNLGLEPDSPVSCAQAAQLLGRTPKFFTDHVKSGDLAPLSTKPKTLLRWGDCLDLHRASRSSPNRDHPSPGPAATRTTEPAPAGRATEIGRRTRERIKRHEQARRDH